MKSTVEDLLARINILDIVSQHIKLRRTGKNFVGLCPFHKEKTPSFTVSIEKQIYYCFGCHSGGNAINFLMNYENLTFQETLENLGRQYGVEVTSGPVKKEQVHSKRFQSSQSTIINNSRTPGRHNNTSQEGGLMKVSLKRFR